MKNKTPLCAACTLLAVSLSILFGVSACKSDEEKAVVSAHKMEAILYDYHLAQGLAQMHPGDALIMLKYQTSILEKHGVTQEQFDTSMAYYMRHAEQMHDIYERLSNRLGDEAVAQGSSLSEIGQENNLTANGDTAKMWFTTNDTALDVVFSLPFVATHFVLDYDKELSDAATVGEAHTQGGSLVSVPTAHAAFRSQAATDIYVEHHWGRPWGTLPEGTVRTARRYWALRGAWDREAAVEGRFRYVRRGYSSSNYPNLDNGFYAQSASRDSIVLLYRPELH